MGNVFVMTVILAMVIALSPTAIIIVLLLLLGPRARGNGLGFLLGWILGLGLLSLVALALAQAGKIAADQAFQPTASGLRAVLGLAVVLMGIFAWRRRPAVQSQAVLPKWVASIDSFRPGRAGALGAALGGLSPKMIIITVGLALQLVQANLSAGLALLDLGVFVLVGSLTIAAPVLYRLFSGSSADRALGNLRLWLIVNNTRIVAASLVLVGVMMVIGGLQSLSGTLPQA